MFLQGSPSTMGGQVTKEDREKIKKEELEGFRKSLKEAADFRVDQNIEKFTSSSSAASLRKHYLQRRNEESDDSADWIQKLKELFSTFSTAAPELAGLGALVVAVHIDTSSFSPASKSTKEALRCVFAEEKVSKVWDLIDECLKRSMIFINQRDELVSNIKELERQLSAAITCLKNSMVNDGHLSTQSLKVWVNGAAFHVQMLVHLVRLGGVPASDPVERLVRCYQSDMATLFRQQEETIRSKCRLKLMCPYGQEDSMPYLIDDQSFPHQMHPYLLEEYGEYLGVYYDQRYGRQQRDVQRYFRKLLEDLPSLVLLTAPSPFHP